MKVEEIIGANVQWIREDQGMSQTQLGIALGSHLGKPWSRQAVSAAEKGRRAFTAAELLALARVLDVTVPSFFLVRNWLSTEVEISDVAKLEAHEYRDRIFHRSDHAATAEFMTKANVQALGAAYLKLMRDHETVDAALLNMGQTIEHLAQLTDLLPKLDAARDEVDDGEHQEAP